MSRVKVVSTAVVARRHAVARALLEVCVCASADVRSASRLHYPLISRGRPVGTVHEVVCAYIDL